jgi:hypothetical protein
LGVEAVAKAMVEATTREIEAEAEKKKAELLAAVEKGEAVAVDTVGINTMIVGSEKTAEGKSVAPKETIVGMPSLKAELAELLQGKKVGDVITLPTSNGNTFEITGLYNPVIVPTQEQLDEVRGN